MEDDIEAFQLEVRTDTHWLHVPTPLGPEILPIRGNLIYVSIGNGCVSSSKIMSVAIFDTTTKKYQHALLWKWKLFSKVSKVFYQTGNSTCVSVEKIWKKCQLYHLSAHQHEELPLAQPDICIDAEQGSGPVL